MTFEEVLYKYKNSYYNFPQSLKTFLGTIYGNIPLSVRFGKNFTLHEKILFDFENANEQFKLDYMYNKTLETLLFAQEHIPYYKKSFNEHGVSAKEFKSLEDIKLFPYITKEDIKNNLNMLYTDIKEKPVTYFSGGSQFAPTQFFLPASSRAKEKAYNNYIFSKINYKHRDKAISLKGRDVYNPEKNTFCEYDPIDNFLFISTNHIASKDFNLIYKNIKKFKPKFFVGYPSAIINFVKESKRNNLDDLHIQGVVLSSETIYADELKLIQEFFGVDVLIHYGHTERNTIGYRINNGKYRFLNSYGLTRVVDEEIITTTFDNFVMPFINYKTADHISGEANCFENSDIVKSVMNIDGRTQDYLVTKDKELISITTMCSGQDYLLENVDAIQYIQSEYGEVTVLLEYSHNIDLQKIKKGMAKLTHNKINFTLNKVNEIEKTPRGKRVICKQSLNIDKLRDLH